MEKPLVRTRHVLPAKPEVCQPALTNRLVSFHLKVRIDPGQPKDGAAGHICFPRYKSFSPTFTKDGI